MKEQREKTDKYDTLKKKLVREHARERVIVIRDMNAPISMIGE